jgi:solute carrier family 25 (mitochondrial phosphate transporter), member 23/24/25/41
MCSFKGLGPTILSGAPYTGIQMTVYELLQRATEANETGQRGVLWTLFNGAIAGLAAQTVTYPGDTVRRRMQTNGAGGTARVYKNSIDCTIKMMKNEGIKGFFKGAWTNTVRCLPGAAIQFAAYEACKKVLGC